MKYLFTTLISDDLGLLARSLRIAAELSRTGSQVLFCNPAHAPSRLIADAGFENRLPPHPLFYLKMTGELDISGFFKLIRSGRIRRDFGAITRFAADYLRAAPLRFPRSTREVWDMDHFAALFGMLNVRFVRAMCKGLVDLIEDYDPDVVVDFWNMFACMAARIARKPLATVIQADMHPASGGFIWWKPRPFHVPSPVRIINRVLGENGLPPIGKTADLFASDMTLVMGLPEIDPLPDHADVKYIGPVLWGRPGVELPSHIDRLPGDIPLVWIYSGNPRYRKSGSWGDSEAMLIACRHALDGEPVRVVLTTGHHPLPSGVQPLPSNFTYAPYLPGIAMAERCALMIHHGGYGSCQTGLFTGTPSLIIPTYSERQSNARRIAGSGAGEFVLPPDRADGRETVFIDEIRMRVRTMLADDSYRANAQRIRDRLKAFGGPEAAARLIGEFASVHRS